MGTAYMPIISTHADELKDREQSWGVYAKPDDYLDSFGRFVREQINQSAALAVVVNRPKDLTREQLREVRLLLDADGFIEANLQRGLAQQEQPGHRRQHHRLTSARPRWARRCCPSSSAWPPPCSASTPARLDAGAAPMAGPPGQAADPRGRHRPGLRQQRLRQDGGAKQLDKTAGRSAGPGAGGAWPTTFGLRPRKPRTVPPAR